MVFALALEKGRDNRLFENVLRDSAVFCSDSSGTIVAGWLTDRWTPNEFEEIRMDIEGRGAPLVL